MAAVIAWALHTNGETADHAPESSDLPGPSEFEDTDTARPSDLPLPRPADDLDDKASDAETSWAWHVDGGDTLEDTKMEGFDDALELDDTKDYRRKLESISKDNRNIRNSPFPPESGPQAQSSSYQFCPPPHRLLLLQIFTKHACQHSLLPEHHRESRSAEDIYL